MSGHWFPKHAPCTAVYAVLFKLYCVIANVYDSSGNVRKDFYVPSRFLLRFKCSYSIWNFICFKRCKVLYTATILFT